MPARLDSRRAGFPEDFARFLDVKRDTDSDVERAVTDIVARVRKEGDAALIDYTRTFDKFDVTRETLAIGADEVARARAACAPDQIAALEHAARRIRDFHARQIPADLDYRDPTGHRLGYRWRPVSAVGMYVPGGTASYPSSVLMNALPAKVAGVSRLVMVVPTPRGEINPLVLAAAQIAGVDEIYRIGGAQAVAALAYGTQTIRAVDKICGPGNAYVAAAKRQVFGAVGIDMVAGPSEVLVVADAKSDPAWIAADLMAQAEHDVNAQSILVTDDAAFAERVERAIDIHLQTLSRSDIARRSWADFGAVITLASLDEAPALIDRIAPEHLELALDDPEPLLARINHAGAIFLGRYAPEALGDYIAGPNHVLPTARSARYSSGLGVFDFLKRSSIISATPAALRDTGPDAVILARAEGLDAHALSISLRLDGSASDGTS
jgi:histidinol dehydrogenase